MNIQILNMSTISQAPTTIAIDVDSLPPAPALAYSEEGPPHPNRTPPILEPLVTGYVGAFHITLHLASQLISHLAVHLNVHLFRSHFAHHPSTNPTDYLVVIRFATHLA